MSLTRYPDESDLEAGFRSMLNERGDIGVAIRVIQRKPNVYTSTFSSEIVTCQMSDRVFHLFLKYYYGENTYSHGHGCRGGLEYEAMVYSNILQKVTCSVAQFFGFYKNSEDGSSWLALEFLDNNLRLHRSVKKKSIFMAASWIGHFHAINERLVCEGGVPFLINYDMDYYRGWAHRTVELSEDHLERFPWLPAVCNNFISYIPHLLSSDRTVIHGEYYAKNILLRNETVYPVDWESAAIAAGEIDLACLIDNWGVEIAEKCKTVYEKSRWPKYKPPDFEKRFTAAQLYAQLRWLGDSDYWTACESMMPYLKRLQEVCEHLGII
jgi:hypothetical protein